MSTHQLDEVLGHGLIVIVDGMHDRINEHSLVTLTQLGHVAKIHICYATVAQRKNVAGMRVAMEQTELHTMH